MATKACLRLAGLLCLLAASSCAGPTDEDRKALAGKWSPADGSGHLVYFYPDGVFDFLYDATPPVAVFRLRWELARKGKVYIERDDRAVYRTCYYTIDGDTLSIDDGSGGECVAPSVTPPTPMPKNFRKQA